MGVMRKGLAKTRIRLNSVAVSLCLLGGGHCRAKAGKLLIVLSITNINNQDRSKHACEADKRYQQRKTIRKKRWAFYSWRGRYQQWDGMGGSAVAWYGRSGPDVVPAAWSSGSGCGLVFDVLLSVEPRAICY